MVGWPTISAMPTPKKQQYLQKSTSSDRKKYSFSLKINNFFPVGGSIKKGKNEWNSDSQPVYHDVKCAVKFNQVCRQILKYCIRHLNLGFFS